MLAVPPLAGGAVLAVGLGICGRAVAAFAAQVSDGGRVALRLALACLHPHPLRLALHQLLLAVARPGK